MKSPSRIFCGLILLGALSASAKEFFVYFGTYTNTLSRGIYVARLDAETGKISEPQLAAESANPCFLATSPDERFIYTANSAKFSTNNSDGFVAALAVDKVTGKLTALNQKSSGGNGPCHVSVDATGKVLFTANYGAGSVKAFSLNADGRLGADGSLVQHSGHGPNPTRQTAPHAHSIAPDPSNHFALACDLGTDQVVVYPFTADAGLLVRGDVQASVPLGAGARHLAFSADEKFVYVVNEMACSVTTFAWNAAKGKLTAQETIPALPPGVEVQKGFTAAEILVHPSGKFVYATLRGHDSVSVFTSDLANGKLQFLQNIPSGGKVPRGMGIDPTGRWLITGNQKTDNAVLFAIDSATGKLTPTGQELKIGSPVDVKFIRAD